MQELARKAGADSASSASRPGRLWLVSFALFVAACAWLAWKTSPPEGESEGRQFFGLWRTRNFAIGLALVWLSVSVPIVRASRRARVRWLTAHVAVVVGWIALEAIGLFGWVHYPKLFRLEAPVESGTHLQPHLDVVGVAHEDLAAMWGLPLVPHPYRYRTDQRGFRNARDLERADIYLVGDSFLVAGLLPFEETLAARMESALERPTMNVALVGLSPQAEAQIFLEQKLPLDGTLVLQFVFEGNDLLDSAAWRNPRTESERPSRAKNTLLNSLILTAQRITDPHLEYARRRMGRIGETDYHFHWLAQSFRGLETELEPIAASLADLRRKVEAAHGHFGVVLIPSKIRVLGPSCTFPPDSAISDHQSQCGPLPEFLSQWAAREGVAYLDLTAALQESTNAGRVPWFADDTHWNVIGHAVATETIVRWNFVRDWKARAAR